ncbi:uncharacterized protein LOC109859888 isoform X2 [Pseudomyrmex gracilis]|uniref:uncharacterized protein LOC109859888 isoform X2 n=1 Tax=Pseudomyrmex gracilis TaxID=219809 RepID=UPI00099533D0|nr:uncharacterized protein LOC109859888 isoform X2 [Pseudomyrmex gracilis]
MALIMRNFCIMQIIMLLFCFAGSFCTASCVSFGSGCWGAHGKRNNVQDIPTMHILADKTLLSESPQNDKALWILSRLIARRATLTDDNRARWKDFSADNTYDSNWQMSLINNENVEPISFPINNDINEREIADVQDAMHVTNENLENIPEILLISSNDKPVLIKK